MSVVYAVAGRHFIGSIVLICSTFLASLGGTGGGIVNVAIFFLIFGFPFHISAVLSICAICGNNLFQVAFNIDKRHPRSRSRPLIYWDAVLILLPAELAGSNIGVIVSKVVPDTIAYILTLIVLSFSGSLCLYEAIAILKKEFRKQEMEEAASLIANQDNSHNPDHNTIVNFKDKKTNPNFSIMKDIVPDYMKRIIFFGNYIPPSENANITPGSYNSVNSNNNHGSIENHHSDLDNSLDIPWNEICWIFATFFFYLICYIIMENFMNMCTPAYFTLLIIMFAVIGIKYCWSYPYLIDKQRNDPDAFLEGDIYWSNLSSYLLPLAMMSIGALTAVLGTGGSELVAPLLLSMKVSLSHLLFSQLLSSYFLIR
jgi:uncharacterized membrane protein YfcA